MITGSPAPGGGEFAFAQLRQTLTLLTGNQLPTACLAIGGLGPNTDAGTGRLTDGAARTSLRHALEALTAPPAAA